MSIYDKVGSEVSVAVIKPQVKIPDVGLSPHTKKVMKQNERVILKDKEKSARFSRLKSVL
ncbi:MULTISPECIES: hypothetical protein [Bacillaceae]|uniref:Uncharacterized protein n=1 Tax=Peribacillus simplex TaxID=1478 RepID=A0A120GPZ5_9BACI|nr:MULTISPECIES: hypothetical protein [Bacillaceae]KWW20507.1 hypothetical protein AS888_18265 [Peribacillus simplex]PJN88704.1 hypothetical protein CVN76_17185 [Bacillus sp. mrc49]